MPLSLNLGGFSLPLEDSAGGSGGNPFDQSLNTTDTVTFGSASFANGAFAVDGNGNITSSINLVGDYINFGTSFLQNNGNIRCNGNISVGNELWLNGDGSASFANGATFIDQYGNLCVGNTGSSYQTFINADGSASFNNGVVQISTYGDFSAKTVNAMGFPGSGPYGWTPMVYMDPTQAGGCIGAMYTGSTDWYICGAANPYDGKSINLDSGNIISDGAGNLHVNSITTATGGTGGFDPASNPNLSGGITVGQGYIYNFGDSFYGPNIYLNADGSAAFGGSDNYSFGDLAKLYISTNGDMYFGHILSNGYYNSVLRADGTAQFGYFNHGGNTFDQYGYLTVPAISVGGNVIDLPTNAGGIDGNGQIYCSNPVSSTSDNSVDSKVEIMINGVTYYLLASTSAS